MAPRKATETEPAPEVLDPKGPLMAEIDRPVQDGAPLVYRAIAEITAAMGDDPIKKEKESGGTGGPKFKYRGVDQVLAALNPLLVRHDLVVIPRMRDWSQVERVTKGGTVMYYTKLIADFDFVSTLDGSIHTATTIGEAMDSSDKSTNKAMSVAYKYACFLTFCIPVDDIDDPDAHGHEDMAPSQRNAANTQQEKPKPRQLTEEEANTNYRAAVAAMEQCATIAALKKVWSEIDWDGIPKPWHAHLQKLQKEMVEEFKKPKEPPPPEQEKPKHVGTAPAFEGGSLDDDVPF